MIARFRSWWQKLRLRSKLLLWWRKVRKRGPNILKQPVFVGSALGIGLLVVVVLGYWLNWHWTGLVPETSEPKQHAKTLWDWLQLLGVLAIPIVVGFGTLWFTRQQGKVADAENRDNQHETALQAYIDKMSELLLNERLRESTDEDEVRKIARVRTLTIFSRLDSKRKGSVLRFLREAELIDKDKCIIDLTKADISKADLTNFDLRRVKLREAVLVEAYLIGADLRGADLNRVNLARAILPLSGLTGANLSGAFLGQARLHGVNLSGADLSDANLDMANLKGADLTGADLTRASLVGTNLSDTNLNMANLKGADLRWACLSDGSIISRSNLKGADLTGADLEGAEVNTEQLMREAKSLKGATMPDGSKHP